MAKRSGLVRLFVLALVGAWVVSPPGRAQDRKPERPPARDQGGPAKPTDKAAGQRSERSRLASGLLAYSNWRQKAQLEIDLLQTQLEAKKAEIVIREAQDRAKWLAADLAILSKLEKTVIMAFPQETPLEDVLKYIKRSTEGPDDKGIPIYVDPVGLEEAGKTMQSPVTLDLEGVPLNTCLGLVLKQVGLTYIVKDGLLTITAESD